MPTPVNCISVYIVFNVDINILWLDSLATDDAKK